MIREVLADRIVHGILLPEEQLDETRLAAEFGVSRTPVREALRQLESVGLALSRPHRGTIVTTLSEEEFHNIFVVMAELECLCARLCAANMGDEERTALQALNQAGADLVRTGEVERYRVHNDRFHDALYAGSRNHFLEDLARSVRRRVSPFRRMQFDAARRIEDSQSEHTRIVAAILDGDEVAAGAAMSLHMRIVERTVDDVTREMGRADEKDHGARADRPA